VKFYDPHIELISGAQSPIQAKAAWYSNNEIKLQVFNGKETVDLSDADYIEVVIGGVAFDSINHAGAIEFNNSFVTIKLGMLSLDDGSYDVKIKYYDFENTFGALLNPCKKLTFVCVDESVLNSLEDDVTLVILQATDEDDGTTAVKLLTDPSGYLLVTEGNHRAGHRNSGSATEDWLSIGEYNHGCLINGTNEITLGKGSANDTFLVNIRVLSNLTGNLTVSGFYTKSSVSDAAQDIVFSTLSAGLYEFNSLASAGPLKVKLSNSADDNKVFVTYRYAL